MTSQMMIKVFVGLLCLFHVLSSVCTLEQCPAIYPVNTVAKLGAKAVLLCRQSSTNIAWMFCPRNGAADLIATNCELAQSAVGSYSLDKSGFGCSLVIDKVTSGHLGTYTCKDLSLNDHGYSAELSSNDNLALSKTAIQVSLGSGGLEGRAVDGVADGQYSKNSCSHTDDGAAPSWWAVDLGAVSSVGRVTITNRADCCPERLKEFDIGLTNVSPWTKAPSLLSPSESSLCNHYTGTPAGGVPTNISCGCDTLPGRYLYVMKKTPILTLCEVEAYYK